MIFYAIALIWFVAGIGVALVWGNVCRRNDELTQLEFDYEYRKRLMLEKHK